MPNGYTKAANIGIRKSHADYIVLLNSDTIVTNNWIEKLIISLLTTPNAGIVGPMSNAASYQSIPNIKGTGKQTAHKNGFPQTRSSIDRIVRRCSALPDNNCSTGAKPLSVHCTIEPDHHSFRPDS